MLPSNRSVSSQLRGTSWHFVKCSVSPCLTECFSINAGRTAWDILQVSMRLRLKFINPTLVRLFGRVSQSFTVPFHGNSDKTLKNRNWINPYESYESNQSLIDSCSSWISRHKSWMPHACNTLCHVHCESRCLKIESCWLLSVGFLMKAWNTCQFWVSNHLFLQF